VDTSDSTDSVCNRKGSKRAAISLQRTDSDFPEDGAVVMGGMVAVVDDVPQVSSSSKDIRNRLRWILRSVRSRRERPKPNPSDSYGRDHHGRLRGSREIASASDDVGPSTVVAGENHHPARHPEPDNSTS